jgi:N-acetylmuramoyl-L-alanine amidase
VDDDSITQSVPDNYVAWHCGGKTYKHKQCRNSNSIGIEICDDVKNGTIYPSAKTIANVLELVAYLMDKYSIPKENVIRHYDVTGKHCPAYWIDNNMWKIEFLNKIQTNTVENYKEQVRKRFDFQPQTIEWLSGYKYADALFEKLATAK